MIKKSAHIIFPILTTIFNKCTELSYFPSAWKISFVKVLKKPYKTDYNDPKSYRPTISLQTSVKSSKNLSIKNLVFITSKNDILSRNQHGFTPGKSTTSALMDITNTALQYKSSHKVAIITIDIAGAFDNAWFPAIIKQLDRHKVPSDILKLIQSIYQTE
ncbi:hypothetical protein DERP_011070 [Dermatophagoides pteronyssinus]|uniref:Reverse transcriptase domain-containing protein n=1 Tax=Dermatophagoides pteronyssinus TaxID=6956 RepID=A0ABQ8J9B1_DERPT|nr:hypothetical protein DERP_011070 [Dermatophagoides pteronyssinus]